MFRCRHERAGFELYGTAVAAARDHFPFQHLGVPDTLDGRFDLVGLYVSLLIRQLRHDAPPGPALAQAVFDAMLSDMDLSLREIGVGDLGVPRRVRAMWEALHGRARAYEAALDADHPAALAAALGRNVWRGTPPAGAAEALAAIARAQAAHLANQVLTNFARGRASFLPAATASGALAPAPVTA